MSTETVTASDGTQLPLASLPTALGLDGSGNVTTMTVVYASIQTNADRTFIQTFTRDGGGKVTNISRWVAQ